MIRTLAPALALLALGAAPAAAQAPAPVAAHDTAGAFADAGAAALFARARAARLRTDRSIRSYTALVRGRFAGGMRMPMKDRTLLRRESAARVRWSRDAASVVQLLGARVQSPRGVSAPTSMSGIGIDELFDPSKDRLNFGMNLDSDGPGDDDEFWIEHPLGEEAERHYRYRSGDTLTLRLQDGRTIRSIELLVTPRRDDPHTLRGALWVDAESGALVQAAFRLARRVDIMHDLNAVDEEDMEEMGKVPGFLKPFEFDISLMTIEYSLWELQHWLPRTMRLEGLGRAGVLTFPAAVAVSYDIEEMVLDGETTRSEEELATATAEEWAGEARRIERSNNGRRYVVLVPQDSTELLQSDLLPPPVWKNAGGFATEAELEAIYDRLAALPGPRRQRLPVRWGWGFGEQDMLRYNRVEALSVGARVTAPLPDVRLSAVGRFGIGDLHPNVEVTALRESLRRTLELNVYHALATADESRSALGLGNSMAALMLGRDEGEYYRATGLSLAWAPPTARRRSWDLTGYVEDQRAVERNTHIALPRAWTDSVFRPNIRADRALQYGAALRYRPWWGTDPVRPQFGLDMLVQPEAGDYQHVRGLVTVRAAAPLVQGVRVAAEAAAGSSAGDVPVQRRFYLGGASTLRGYEPGTITGTSMARGRLELARAHSWSNVVVFSDWAWAGERADIRDLDQRVSIGVGASVLDGLIRIDLARALRQPRGWRLDLHMDAIM